MPLRQYQELIGWKKSMTLVGEIYRRTRSFPKDEIYGLTSQLRCAAVSIPSNIAEGQGRLTRGEFKQFLGHAHGSIFEVETQLLHCAGPRVFGHSVKGNIGLPSSGSRQNPKRAPVDRAPTGH